MRYLILVATLIATFSCSTTQCFWDSRSTYCSDFEPNPNYYQVQTDEERSKLKQFFDVSQDLPRAMDPADEANIQRTNNSTDQQFNGFSD